MRQLHEKETCVELLEGEILWFCGVVLGAASAAGGVVNSNPSRASLDPAALNVEHGVRDQARALLDQTRACSTWLTLW
jgi:hypothetical protein